MQLGCSGSVVALSLKACILHTMCDNTHILNVIMCVVIEQALIEWNGTG